MQKLKLKVANTGSNPKGQKGKSLKKVGLEQNVDDNSSSSEKSVTKDIEVNKTLFQFHN